MTKFLKKMSLTLCLLCISAIAAFAQTTVKGVVVDANGPVIGAAVLEVGTNNGTSTGIDGDFTLTVSRANATVEVSCIGYATQTFPANQVPSRILLVEDSEFLEETVVVGYGVQKKSNVTGAIAQVKSDALENRSDSDVGSALQGKLAGVQVLTTSSAPGAGSSFRIRGYSSTNSSPDPLILVDGLKVQSIDYLDPESIESIEVLKDAASAAIYGSQAGNGVVLVTTKSGSKDNVRIFYNNMFTWMSPMENIKMMNAQQFKTYWQEAAGYPDASFQSADTNWQDVMFETGFRQRHTIGLSGANERFTYYVDGTYMGTDGMITGPYDTFNRITGQINVSYQIKPWLKVGTNNTIERANMRMVSENNMTGTGSAIGGAYYYDPTVPVFYATDGDIPAATGLLAAEAAGQPVQRDDEGRMYGQSLLMQSNLFNPLLMRDQVAAGWMTGYQFTSRTNINGTAYADITPSFIKGLTFTSRLGYRLSSNYRRGYSEKGWINAQQIQASDIIQGTESNQQYWQWENFANYLKSFGKHDLALMVGMEFSETHMESINAYADGLTNNAPNFRYLQYYDPNATTRRMGGSEYSRFSESFFGRLAWTFANRYNAQVNFRADAYGMSKLSKKNRWGFFPSVSLGWTVSNENFFKNIFRPEAFSYMKIRASYGVNGNINSLTDFTWTNGMSLSGLYNFGDGVVTPANPSSFLANEDLKWETSKQVDVGVDFRFLRDRLTFTVDWYNKNTTDMLVSVPAPAVSGASNVYINGGLVNNSGWEFDLGWKDTIGDFRYGITANLSTVHSMVVESPLGAGRTAGGANFFLPITYLESGYPMWYIRGFKHKGINAETGLPEYYTPAELDEMDPGHDHSDGATYLGDGIPDFTYGITLNLAWKGFDFTVFGSGVQGNEMFLCISRPDLPIANLPAFVFENRWTPQTASTATWPKGNQADNSLFGGHYQQSDFWVFDASYFKIKQIQLGYTLPRSLTQKLHIQSLRIYGSVENAFTFTKYPGNDPESRNSSFGNGIALDRVNYPSARNFMFGVNLSF